MISVPQYIIVGADSDSFSVFARKLRIPNYKIRMISNEALKEINKAINTYIETNSIYGCMDRTSNSFNWIANINDKTCNQNVANIQFAGLILSCDIKWNSNNDSTYRLNDMCNDLKKTNFYTNNEQCPSSFSKTLIYSSIKILSIEKIENYGCGFLWLSTCTRSTPIGIATRTINLYSCTKNNSGLSQYIFGGSYSSNKINFLTNEKSCQTGFTPVSLINGINICLTQQIVNPPNIFKFGGIFSCQTNNSDICPIGFSPYIIGLIDTDCNLYACLQLKAQDIKLLPTISLPPYFNIIDQLTSPSINISNNIINGKLISILQMAPITIDQSLNLAIKSQFISWILFLPMVKYFIF
ncbi:unnamed protein product [Adineta ricciae]|uniref:Uncharacterized protein n=2 Tax=Adineta ricciae TaxID=249248 RepID=A0A815SDV1_ADIRI|nr:unnamed protein product [Adineta ricciae]